MRVAWLVIASLSLTACLGGDPLPVDPPPAAVTFAEGVCSFPRTLPAFVDSRCGTVAVPADRRHPERGRVDLAVAVFHDRRVTAPEPDPVVYLQGGPGAAAIAYVADGLSVQPTAFDFVLARRALIVFDQRGTGLTQPALSCDDFRSDPTFAAIDDCRARLLADGIDPADYRTAVSAQDADDVRRALGYPRWNLFGASYGTFLGLEGMRRFPATTRAVVLDSVVPLQVDAIAELGPNAWRAFSLVFQLCAQQADCQQRAPDLQNVFLNTVKRLDATPATVALRSGAQVTLTGTWFAFLMFELLYDQNSIGRLPDLITRIGRGDDGALAEVYDETAVQSDGFSDVDYELVNCADESPFSSVAAVDQREATLPPGARGLIEDRESFARCRHWAVPAGDPSINQAVNSALPALLLAGQFDPVTPPDWARLAASTLSRSFTFELPGRGHGVFVDPCGAALIRRFLDAPLQPPRDPCVDAVPPSPFARTPPVARSLLRLR